MKTTLLDQGRRGIPLTESAIIDIHSHIGRPPFSIPATTADSIVDVMARTGVVTTVITAMLPVSPRETDRANESVLEAVRAYPGRLLGYLRVCPASEPVALREAERQLDAGFTGLKLHNVNGTPYTHPAYMPFLAAANERRMPVLFHTWGQDEEFNQIRKLTARHPALSLLLAHSGSSQEKEYTRVARQHPRIYLELALSRSPRGLVDRLVEGAGADKVVWGSDVCFINQAHQLGKVLGATISEEQKIQVMSTNARLILERVRS